MKIIFWQLPIFRDKISQNHKDIPLTQPEIPPESLDAVAIAARYGITERAARSVLSGALDGKPWRKHRISVQTVSHSGGRKILAEAASLPPAPILPASRAPTPKRPGKYSTPDARLRVIRDALKQPDGSAARHDEIMLAVMETGIGRRTIYRWISDYMQSGMAGLADSGGRGRKRALITAAWDRAVDFDDATRQRIADDAIRYIRSLWAGGAGVRIVMRAGQKKLEELTRAAGYDGDDLEAICTITDRLAKAHKSYRAVHDYDTDAKKWFDEKPRIARSREGLRPMQLVWGDVHPMDVLLQRPDGSPFTAKLVAFQDAANNRVFVYPVFLEKGQGVRQAHIVEAFIAMTQDPRWGVPEILYLDNGKEYACLDLIQEALGLNTRVRAASRRWEIPADTEEGRIVRALPYNSAAKAIEGLFAVLERGYFSMMQGYIGGNRMQKKTANVGRAPVPYQGGMKDFRAELDNLTALYDTTPQRGTLDGRTPREAFEAAMAAGWKRADIDRDALLIAFAKPGVCTVKQGKFRHGGRDWTAPEIQSMPHGKKIDVRVPIIGTDAGIAVMDAEGRCICIAFPDRPYHILDRTGAAESTRRQKRARDQIKQLKADVDEIDLSRVVANLNPGPGAIPGAGAKIELAKDWQQAGRKLAKAGTVRPAEKTSLPDRLALMRDLRTRGVIGKVKAGAGGGQ